MAIKMTLLTTFIVTLLISSVLIGSARFPLVQASTDVSGILRQNATWIKANSPYNLSGPLSVFQGATLTIEPGVTVNLNGYYIQVNGTLIAKGTDNEKISFNSGSVAFTPVSVSWNEQTGSGSIIQNAILDSISVNGVSVKINQNSLNGLDVNGGSSTISHNTIRTITINNGSPSITNNEVTGNFIIENSSPSVTSNTINTRIMVRSGTPTISNNTIYDGIHADSRSGKVTISGNKISSKNNFVLITVIGTDAQIFNNELTGNNNPAGIVVSGVLSSATIIQNQIYRCQTGIEIYQCNVKIYGNIISNNDLGISITFYKPTFGATGPWGDNKTADVQGNNITKNSIGIKYAPFILTSTITGNNIYENGQYNFKLQYESDVTIPNNWWGTTDIQAINQTIYDFKKDFNLGTVNFTPVLMQPNTQALTIPTATPTTTPPQTTMPSTAPTQTTLPPTISPTLSPTLTPTSTQNQTTGPSTTLNPVVPPSQTQTELPLEVWAVIGLLVALIVALAVVVVLLLRRQTKP